MVTTVSKLLPVFSVSPGLHVQDISHWWGQDWQLTPTGDIQTVDGIPKDNQRLFRRLCTNGDDTGAQVGEYYFHPDFGGSAPWYVGQPVDPLILEGIIRQQMYMEQSVSHSPEPIINVTTFPNGTFSADIQYQDVQTGQPVPLLVSVTG